MKTYVDPITGLTLQEAEELYKIKRDSNLKGSRYYDLDISKAILKTPFCDISFELLYNYKKFSPSQFSKEELKGLKWFENLASETFRDQVNTVLNEWAKEYFTESSTEEDLFYPIDKDMYL